MSGSRCDKQTIIEDLKDSYIQKRRAVTPLYTLPKFDRESNIWGRIADKIIDLDCVVDGATWIRIAFNAIGTDKPVRPQQLCCNRIVDAINLYIDALPNLSRHRLLTELKLLSQHAQKRPVVEVIVDDYRVSVSPLARFLFAKSSDVQVPHDIIAGARQMLVDYPVLREIIDTEYVEELRAYA